MARQIPTADAGRPAHDASRQVAGAVGLAEVLAEAHGYGRHIFLL